MPTAPCVRQAPCASHRRTDRHAGRHQGLRRWRGAGASRRSADGTARATAARRGRPQAATVAGVSPSSSLPSTRASGTPRGTSCGGTPPRGTAARASIPGASARRVPGRSVARKTSSASSPPSEVRKAASDSPAWRGSPESTIARQPKKAADRAMAPRLCGLPMPSSTGVTRAARSTAGGWRASSAGTARGSARATMPPWCCVPAMRARSAVGTSR